MCTIFDERMKDLDLTPGQEAKGVGRDFSQKGCFTLPPRCKNPLRIASIDCDLCQTKLGLEVIRITVVNELMVVVLDELVKPKGEIVQSFYQFHGIDIVRLETAMSLHQVQQLLCQMCDQATTLVGFDLDCDLNGLQLSHGRCIDINKVFNRAREEPLTLNGLSQMFLGKTIKCYQDYPKATMMLAQLMQRIVLHNINQARSFGSKQDLIGRIHQHLVQKYKKRLIRPLKVWLRGKDTLRLHCKKWDQLIEIEKLLNDVDRICPFRQICLPISMKTKTQKKGFFVYLKFGSELVIPTIMEHLKKYTLFKVEIADRNSGKVI